MKWYELVKIVHFLGLIAVIGFFVIYSRAGPKLRAATDLSEVKVWLGLLELARPMVPGGAVMLLASGLTMAWMRWRGPYAFIGVGMVTLIIVWVLVARTAGAHLRAMMAGAMNSGDSGSVPAQLSQVILATRPWSTLFALNLATLGVLVVMTLKLSWVGAIATILVLSALGAFVGARLVESDRAKHTARSSDQ
jgi:hypothetical protein